MRTWKVRSIKHNSMSVMYVHEVYHAREEVRFTKGHIIIRGKLILRGKGKRVDYTPTIGR